MELKFIAAKKPKAGNVTVQRRQRLVRRIDQQIELIQNAGNGLVPRTSWVWIDDKGKYLFHIKYGKNSIELRKGTNAIECEDLEKTRKALEIVKEMVLAGEYDNELTKAAECIKTNFKR